MQKIIESDNLAKYIEHSLKNPENDLKVAGINGSIKIFQYLHETLKIVIPTNYINIVFGYGQFEIVIYLLNLDYGKFISLSIIKYIKSSSLANFKNFFNEYNLKFFESYFKISFNKINSNISDYILIIEKLFTNNFFIEKSENYVLKEINNFRYEILKIFNLSVENNLLNDFIYFIQFIRPVSLYPTLARDIIVSGIDYSTGYINSLSTLFNSPFTAEILDNIIDFNLYLEKSKINKNQTKSLIDNSEKIKTILINHNKKFPMQDNEYFILKNNISWLYPYITISENLWLNLILKDSKNGYNLTYLLSLNFKIDYNLWFQLLQNVFFSFNDLNLDYLLEMKEYVTILNSNDNKNELVKIFLQLIENYDNNCIEKLYKKCNINIQSMVPIKCESLLKNNTINDYKMMRDEFEDSLPEIFKYFDFSFQRKIKPTRWGWYSIESLNKEVIDYKNLPKIKILPQFKNIKSYDDLSDDLFSDDTYFYFTEDSGPDTEIYLEFYRSQTCDFVFCIENSSGFIFADDGEIITYVAKSLPEFLSRLLQKV
jgi:hypothetical protein